MTPSEIADWLDTEAGKGQVDFHSARLYEAAATIRELDKKCKGIQHRADLDRALNERMRHLLEEADAKLKIATEALNSAAVVLSGEEMTKGSLIRAIEQVNKALARMKEVG